VSPVGRCGLGDCPVPEPDPALLRRLRTRVVPADTVLHRGVKQAHPDTTALVPGVGNTRFAPLHEVAHAYVATTAFAALLESAFHEAAPPDRRIYQWQIDAWLEGCIALIEDVRLIDLGDAELDRLGLGRSELVATDAVHYRCTRAWAEALHDRTIGGQKTHGLVWDSRQTELQAAELAGRPALAELVTELPAAVAVIWSPPAARRVLDRVAGGLGPLNGPDAAGYIDDLIATLGIVVE
jgi:hypothetical protein